MAGYPTDREALDRQYSPSHKIDDIDAYLSAYAGRSKAARETFGDRARNGLRYGPHRRHTLDYFPAETAGAPLLVFVHGGFWQQLDPSYFSYPAMDLCKRGVSYAALGYRLAPEANLTQIVADTRLALSWLFDRAASLAFDSRRVVLSGHSAGAQLCAMMLTCEWPAPAAPFAGALLMSGVYELEPLRHSYVNERLGMSEAEAASNSPALLDPIVRCPVVVAYAENDPAAFQRQSKTLQAAWQACLPRCELVERDGRHHFDIVLELAQPGAVMFEHALSLFERPDRPVASGTMDRQTKV